MEREAAPISKSSMRGGEPVAKGQNMRKEKKNPKKKKK